MGATGSPVPTDSGSKDPYTGVKVAASIIGSLFCVVVAVFAVFEVFNKYRREKRKILSQVALEFNSHHSSSCCSFQPKGSSAIVYEYLRLHERQVCGIPWDCKRDLNNHAEGGVWDSRFHGVKDRSRAICWAIRKAADTRWRAGKFAAAEESANVDAIFDKFAVEGRKDPDNMRFVFEVDKLIEGLRGQELETVMKGEEYHGMEQVVGTVYV